MSDYEEGMYPSYDEVDLYYTEFSDGDYSGDDFETVE